jgi:hypothetical protein
MLDSLEGLAVYYNDEVPANDASDVVVRLDINVELHPLFFRYVKVYFDTELDETTVKVATVDSCGEIAGYVTAVRSGATESENANVLSKIFNTIRDFDKVESAIDFAKRELNTINSPAIEDEETEIEDKITPKIPNTESKLFNPETDNIQNVAYIILNTIDEYDGIITIKGRLQSPDSGKYLPLLMYNDGIIKAKTSVDNFEFTFSYDIDGELEFYIEIAGYGWYSAVLNYDIDCRLRSKYTSFALSDSCVFVQSEKSNAIIVNNLIGKPDLIKTLIERALNGQTPTDLLKEYLSSFSLLSEKRICLFVDCKAVEQQEKIEVISVESGSNEHKLYSLFAERIFVPNDDSSYIYPFEDEKYQDILMGLSRGVYELVA